MRYLFEGSVKALLRLFAITMLSFTVAACSGGGDNLDGGEDIDDGTGGGGNGSAPTATVSPDGELGTREPVIVTFSESMEPESLALGGTMANAAQTSWSNADSENDTLTIEPASQWSTGTHTLVLDAEDTDGDTLETLNEEFVVRLAIDDFADADVVIGQQDFSTGAANQGGTADANTLNAPVGSVSFAPGSGRLFVSDTDNARVLGFDDVPTENNVNADIAIGQPDFTATTGDTSATRMRSPYATSTATGQLVVTDTESHRVLIFDEIPATGPAAASVVVGQQTMTSRETACSANNLNSPRGHAVTPDGKLIVADTDNHRVLIWNELPTANGTPPDLVLGQDSFTNCTANDDDQDNTPSPDWPPHAYTLSSPTAVWSDGEKLLVADSGNHRVLIWDEFPTRNFAPADRLLGQNSFRSMTPNDSDQDGTTDGPSAEVFNYPNGVWSDGNQIFVSDRENHRVLVWNAYPEHFFAPADSVIGQGSFNTNAPNDANQDGAADGSPSANTLRLPGGVTVVDDRLVITDSGNSRVLLYTTD